MKRCIVIVCSLLLILSFTASALADRSTPLIIDHTCTDLSQIPSEWIDRAKELTLHYAHTSHGSQIISGINNLESLDAFFSVTVRTSGSEGLPSIEDPPALRVYDGNPPETYITPEDYWNGESGIERTRAVAATGHYLFSMWSWCGQVSGGTETYIQNYLDTLDQLQTEFPDMEFIYMTGHLDGSGSTGTLHRNNERIREYCRANNKILFDFADIERYTPDGMDLLDSGADDACNYDGGNWAQEWCADEDNQGSDLCDACSCAHSQALNCNQKARAFWWMMARLAGWGACIDAPTELAAQGDSRLGQITLTWTAPSGAPQADTLIVHRRVDNGQWDTAFAVISSGNTYVDTGLDPGTYAYRVIAHLNDNGEGIPCDSATSNTASATLAGADSDGDGIPDAQDQCPDDVSKSEAGQCGCGTPDTDSDGDQTADCLDLCPNDPGKIEPGECGCGFADTDSDGDQTSDCLDLCPQDPLKIDPGQCGCGTVESDPCNSGPLQPALISPTDGATDVGLTPPLNAGPFEDPDAADTHAVTTWQISTTDDFSNLVLDIDSDDDLTSLMVADPLTAETTYYWRVRYTDSRGESSTWSTPCAFTTTGDNTSQDMEPASSLTGEEDDDDFDWDNITCFIGTLVYY